MESTSLLLWSPSPFSGMSQGEDVETVSVKIQVVSRFFELTSCTREVNVTTTIADNGSHPVQYLVLQTINITEVYCQCHFVFYGHNVFVYFTKVTYFSRKDLKLI